MDPFLCIHDLSMRIAAGNSATQYCVACGIDSIRVTQQALYDWWPRPSDSRRLTDDDPPRVMLCLDCHTICAEACQAARALMVRCGRDSALPLYEVGRRIALFRALSRWTVPDACVVPTYHGYCVWCRALVRVSRLVVAVSGDQGTAGGRWELCMHSGCWAKMHQMIHTERISQCMRSLAWALPILPEVRGAIALLVVQMSAAGIEASH